MYFNIVNYHQYNREMADELKLFYRAKAKDKKGAYGYDADGNLVVREKETVVKTISLPTYRPPTAEEIDEMEKEHATAIALANKVVDDARTALYTMSQNPERDDSTMVRLNRAVMEADSKLYMVRFPLRYINREEGIKIRQLDFTQPNETRVLPYPVAIIETRPFPLQQQYVRIGEPAAAPFVSVAEAKIMMEEAAGVPIIVFEGADSNEYGYLSMEWKVVLEYNSTTYQSVHQAIYSELAKLFDDQEHLLQFLAAETADEITYSVEDVPGDLEKNKEKWNENLRKLIYEVNLVKFRRYPELASKLLETKNAMIGAYEPGDEMIGIGISLENVDSKDPAKWGENILGKALMNIRELLHTEQSEASVKTEPSEASVKTEPSIKKRRPPVSRAAQVEKVAPVSSKETIPLQNMSEPISIAAVAAPVAVPVAAPVAAPVAESMAAPAVVPVAEPIAASAAPVAAERRRPRVASKVKAPT